MADDAPVRTATPCGPMRAWVKRGGDVDHRADRARAARVSMASRMALARASRLSASTPPPVRRSSAAKPSVVTAAETDSTDDSLRALARPARRAAWAARADWDWIELSALF